MLKYNITKDLKVINEIKILIIYIFFKFYNKFNTERTL